MDKKENKLDEKLRKNAKLALDIFGTEKDRKRFRQESNESKNKTKEDDDMER